MGKRGCFLALVLLLGTGAAALAQSNIALRLVAQREVRVTTESGASDLRMIEAREGLPGDELVYTLFFTNRSDLPATEIVIVNPIPPGMALKAGSVFGAGTRISYSVDGGRTYGAPGELGMIENGEPRQARAEEYTHVRWIYGETLAAGAEGMVGFRAILR